MRGSDVQAAVAQAAIGVVLTGLGALLVLTARDLDIPVERLAGMSAGVGVGLLAVGAAGPWLLRRGPHPSLRAGAVAMAAGCVVFALAPTLLVAIAGVLLLGAGGAALIMVTPALVTGEDMAVRFTRVIAVGSACALLAPLAIGALDATGVTGRLILLPLVVPLLALAFSRPAHSSEPQPTAAPSTEPHPTEPRPAATSSAAAHTAVTSPASARSITARPTHARGAEPRPGRPRVGSAARRWSGIVLAVSVEFCFTVWAVARLRETGVSPTVAALLGTSFPAGMAIGRLVAAPLLPRIPAVPIGGAITCAAALVVAASQNRAIVTTALVVAGIGVATLYPVTVAALVDTPGLARHHAVSLSTVASGTAILAAPTALAAIAGHTGLRAAFLVTSPLIAAVIAVHGLRRTPVPAADLPA
ncbi:MFS transporter [Actinoplanes sp. LDG1-06]|uniref:MFS transporter n=1 Tax=Paractinoplanes ovalisporus TaxID=2810368 RepID=A0ABS2A725_9ACTN|nr:MFS transporter [Actinoplanes ovalisporus]MBM2615051.1 MFS transporter [Actinoplanes ovalisporus]